MNALTKTFVVVVALLAIILVALVVPFAAQVPDYAQQYKDMKAQADAAQRKNSEAAAAARQQIAAQGKGLDDADKQITALENENTGLRDNIAALELKLLMAKAAQDQGVAANQVLVQANEAKDAMLAERAGLIQKQLGSLATLQSQVGDLSQTLGIVRAENRRLSDNYLRIQEENKALTTQLSEAQAKYQDIYKRWIALGGDSEKLDDTTVSDINIQGAVVKIDQVSDGLTFVQVNVGSRDQVKPGMVFTVYRGDEFVGNIKIDTVDTAEAVGRLTLGGGVKEGDAIRSGSR